MILFDLLKFEEGYSEKPYIDTEGYPTIGVGTKIGSKGASLEKFTLTINKEVAESLLKMRVDEKLDKLEKLDWFNNIKNTPRRIIIISMCYQMGVSGVSNFKNMIAALEREDFEEASKQAMDSRWARQTPARAERHAKVLLNGNFDCVDEYKDF